MKWIAIAGTWQSTNEQVEADVRKEVAEIIKSGNGIVTSGALGVDFFATDEALRLLCKTVRIPYHASS
jgi:predicted Rossmann fold nucleotide-binding protein DprA/Smf involved in DNA uptake